MSTVKKATITSNEADVAEKVKNHSNDSYVVKKVAQAKEMMSKVKLPDHLKTCNI